MWRWTVTLLVILAGTGIKFKYAGTIVWNALQNRWLSWCQFCRHIWLQWKLSPWQAPVQKVTTTLMYQWSVSAFQVLTRFKDKGIQFLSSKYLSLYIYIRPVFILDWWKNKIPSSLEYRKTYICTSTLVVMRMDFINIDRTQEYEIAPFLATRGTLPMFDSETEILQFRNVYDSMNSVVGATSPCCEIEQNTAFCAGQLNQWNLGLIFLQIQYRLTH